VTQRTPQYLRIYQTLKRRLDDGELAPGSRLAPQRELSREFAVTLMTLRQAIALLEQEGLVVTRHGRGTYVAPRRALYTLGSLRSLAQEMASQGLELETRVLAAGLRPATPAVAERLLTTAGDDVYVVERLRIVAGEPVALQRSHLPGRFGGKLASLDLTERSLYDALAEALHLRVARAQESLGAVSLDAHDSRLLGEKAGAPALLSVRVTYASDGQPVLYDRALLPGSKLAVTSERRADDVTVPYEREAAEVAMA
jgi:GntR family transcriptional regulator